MRVEATVAGQVLPVEVREHAGGYRVRVGDEWLEVEGRLPAGGPASLVIGGVSYLVDLAEEDGEVVVTFGAEPYRVRVVEHGRALGRRGPGSGAGAGQRLVAPMPGRVVAVHVRPGDRVEAGAPLVVLEAMKMENEFRATAGGVVTDVPVSAGQAVNAGDLLVAVAPGDP
jgi:3-methylcrotonyl-CoA carboxylase alpha subunit